MHVDGSRGAIHARPCVAVFVIFVVLALSAIILFDFLRTSRAAAAWGGRRGEGCAARISIFVLFSLFGHITM